MRTFVYRAFALFLLIVGMPAEARLREAQMDVPVQVTTAAGRRVAQPIRVTLFWDDANPRPAPVLVLNHGRAPAAADRAAFGRARYHVAAGFFAERGFIVAVPTRIGYGVSGGEDVEDSGACATRRYAPAYEAALAQTLAVLNAVRERPGVDGTRAVIVGQSFGGAVAIAAAAHPPAGLVATINFAGGGGGNPITQAQHPCSPQAMGQLFMEYGRLARLPTLWLYAENDQYFGPTYPRGWFQTFRQAGGNGEFVQFPPQGDDGHKLFTAFPEVWQPQVGAFLDRLGFPRISAGR
ncbi:dienelactone hydrolase family protein [Variovorax ginsengisoli]|uniref:Dienelactone hydrolase n=1 Tax=Variovorax ginsengisoli TaxID=363844 RepID=A0ABT9S7Q3_9BURK|nr:dienelactone hydrolase family protein [Variovorax ginsengisoli]MDP9900388.1 dienelactone hydrolase [Variovorax ginsengisoli]